jgi:hypothetical protein
MDIEVPLPTERVIFKVAFDSSLDVSGHGSTSGRVINVLDVSPDRSEARSWHSCFHRFSMR